VENLKAVGEAAQAVGVELADLRARVAASEARLQQASEAADPDVEATLRQAVERGDLEAWRGKLIQALQPAADLDLAIRAALGVFSEGFGFDSADTVGHAAEQLGDGHEATAAIVALSGLRPPPRPPAPSGEGIVGNAADLARPTELFREAVETLLGKTWVVRDRRTARRLLPALPEGCRLVTLKGDVFRRMGMVLNAARPFRGKKEIADRLSQDLDSLRAAIGGARVELRRLNHRLDNAARK
jgi:chromosome segregation ATPase